MKELLKRYRTWCSNCKDWTIFTMNAYSSNPIDMNLHCSICNNNILEYSILDIPKDKILEQRERYVNKEEERLVSNIGLFEMIGMDNSIKEDDTGLIKARKEEDILRKAEKERRYNLLCAAYEEAKKYGRLGRNDKCICGSGKKFKNCDCYKYSSKSPYLTNLYWQYYKL